MGGYEFRVVILGLLACCCLTSAAASDEVSLDDLGWLTGRWVLVPEHPETECELPNDQSGSEEVWTTAKGGVMLGLGRVIRPCRSTFFEYLRIEERSGTLVLVASPMGEGATEFQLVKMEGQQAVFENPGHDMPQRISYHRVDDRLYGVTWGREGEVEVTDSSVWHLQD